MNFSAMMHSLCIDLGLGFGLENSEKLLHCSWVFYLKLFLLTCDRRLLAAIASISFHSVNSASASVASQMLLAPESTPGLEIWRQWRGLAPGTSTLSTSLTTHPGSSTAPLGRVSWRDNMNKFIRSRQLLSRLRKALRILCKILFNYLTCVKIKTYNVIRSLGLSKKKT